MCSRGCLSDRKRPAVCVVQFQSCTWLGPRRNQSYHESSVRIPEPLSFLQTRLPSWYVKARPQSSLVRLPDIVSLPRVPLLANVDVIVSGRSNEVANVTRLPPETEQSGGVVHPEVGVEVSLHVSHCTTALRTHPSAVPLACLCESLCLCACVYVYVHVYDR